MKFTTVVSELLAVVRLPESLRNVIAYTHWAHGVVATLNQRRNNVVCQVGNIAFVTIVTIYISTYINM